MTLNHTHDPAIKSWVSEANNEGADFPIQNLPFCAFTTNEAPARLGIGIGLNILDLTACDELGLLDGLTDSVRASLRRPELNDFMALGKDNWHAVRSHLFDLLQEGNAAQKQEKAILVAQSDVKLVLAMTVGDFTDFECSHPHARRMNRLMSGENVPRNGFFLPRAYHGRSSSVTVSGEPVYLPWGQTAPDNITPEYRACERFDYELELGIIIGTGNQRGHPISVDTAEEHIFGFCILNDWSARDIQRWERLPLGPFSAKNHQTFVSPWIVTREALAPFRGPQEHNVEGRPERPLPHLDRADDAINGALSIDFNVTLSTDQMRAKGMPALETSVNTFLDASWSLSQIIAQHTAGGCNLRPGDLIGSGTISGEADNASACLMELAELGQKPIELPSGESRGWLTYGDEVTFAAASEKPGYPKIGFGICQGRVHKAPFMDD